MKKIFFLAILSFITLIGKSQSFDDRLYSHIYDFMTLSGKLNSGDLPQSELRDYFLIVELLPNTNSSRFKIYKFTNMMHEESIIDFLVIKDESYELYDVRSSSVLISRILDESIDCSIKLLWIKKILQISDTFKSVILDNAVLERKFSGFTYYIPLGNYCDKIEN